MDALLKDLESLKRTVAQLTERVWALEQRLDTTRLPTSQPAQPGLTQTVSVVPPSIPSASVESNEPSVVDPILPVPASPQLRVDTAPPRETVETIIGRYWLNRAGIFVLVLGIAFFILYTFQYLGAWAKLGIGWMIAGGLLGLGIRLDRHDGLSWFARGLTGGGWALLYFTTYAMHHIASVRVLPSAALDLMLLAVVTAASVRQAISYRSQAITGLAFLLGFITISIGHITYFTLAAAALLVIALTGVAVRMRWHGLLLFGIVASYLTHVAWLHQQIALSTLIARTGTVATAEFWLHAGFLNLYWVTFTIGLLGFTEEESSQRDAMVAGAVINNGLGLTQLLVALPSAYLGYRYLVLLGLAGVCAMVSRVASQRRLAAVANIYQFVALGLATLVIPERLTRRWISMAWLLEIPWLAWVGRRWGRRVYDIIAAGLTMIVTLRLLLVDFDLIGRYPVLMWTVSWRLLIGLIAIVAFALAAACYRRPSGSVLGVRCYTTLAVGLAALLMALEVQGHSLPVWWMAGAVAVILLGAAWHERWVRGVGAVWSGLAALAVLLTILDQGAQVGWLVTLAPIALLYASAACYRWGPVKEISDDERRLFHAYSAVASGLLTVLFWAKVPGRWLSQVWAVEGLALLSVGFAIRSKTQRVCGLVVFGLLMLKVLFVDLAGAETIYRIWSFIIAGAILLTASFIYGKLMSDDRV